MRFCTNWQTYADVITIRSGRWLDGVYYSDEERSKRIKNAAERETTARVELEEAFRALGFDPGALGEDKVPKKARPVGSPPASSSSSSGMGRPRTAGEEAQRNVSRHGAGGPSPYAHSKNSSASPYPHSSSTAGSALDPNNLPF